MLKKCIVFVAMLSCLAGAADSLGQSQRRPQQMRIKQPEPAVTQENRHEGEKGTEQSPLIVKVAPTPKTADERAEETKERDRIADADRKKAESDAKLVEYTGELAFFTKSLFFATSVLVFATIGLGVAAFFQGRDTKRSANAANRAAIVAEQALTKLERALVAPGNFDIRQVVTPAGNVVGYEVTLPWLNTGSTPARKFLTHINWDTFIGDIPAPYGFPDIGVQVSHPIYIAPKANAHSVPLGLPVEFLEAVRVQHIRLFFYGWCTYWDIFDGTPQHITKFCFELYRIDSDPYGRATVLQHTWHFRPYTRHHCIDEDCDED